MSLFSRIIKTLPPCGAGIIMLAVLAACSVQPLYSARVEKGHSPDRLAPGIRDRLSSIAIDEPHDHMTQLVRNRLVYLLAGGAGPPSSPAYRLKLNVRVQVKQAVRVNIGDMTDREGRASAGTVIASSNYVLKDPQDKPLFIRKRSVTSSFDRPRQEYANLQAEENAKERAAEELAERIFLSLAQDFSRR